MGPALPGGIAASAAGSGAIGAPNHPLTASASPLPCNRDPLHLSPPTVTHHLDKLEEHDVVECGQEGYGALYFLTDRFESHREIFQEIVDAGGAE